MINSKKEMGMFRAFLKKALKERGLDFKKHLTPKEAEVEAENLNQTTPGLNLTGYEILIVHRIIMHELIDEYFSALDAEIIAVEKSESKKRKEKTVIHIPG